MAAASAAAAHHQRRIKATRLSLEQEQGILNDSVPYRNVKKMDSKDLERRPRQPGFWKYQNEVYAFYTRPDIEVLVAFVIVANFITNIIEKQIDPELDRIYDDTWIFFMYFYNVIFLIELWINMYGSWLCPFWKDGWNVFDFVVVSIGVLDMLQVQLPGPLSMLRMMRAFRVFRLFKRVESLKKILVSIARAVPGVLNAFLILLIVMCIYAILAVELFKFEDTYIDKYGIRVEYTSARGNSFGDEYFGNFFKALYTMFQVLTGESWSEAVARPLLNGIARDDREHNKWNANASMSAIFFVSFQLLCSIVLINVVVAVLLEKMVDPEEEIDEDGDQMSHSQLSQIDDISTRSKGNVMESIEEGKSVSSRVFPASPINNDSSGPSGTSNVTANATLKESLNAITTKIDTIKADALRDIELIKRNTEESEKNLRTQLDEINSMLATMLKNNTTK